MTRCPGCYKTIVPTDAYCGACTRRMFDGKKVPAVLPFSRPDYNQAKLAGTTNRMSISGIQTKISLALNQGRLEMVESGGQYILKPIPYGPLDRLSLVPINEHLSMQIAHQVFDLQVAANALVQFKDGEPAYLVRRFDIQPDGKHSLQEDFAQIASRSEESHGGNYKYDCSYEEIAELIRRHVNTYRVDLERFFTLVAFNYLIHNGDAHLKNFSLIRNEATGEYNLAPAYDLLNTRLHLPQETITALELFKDDFETESYRATASYAYDDFVVFARRLGLVEKRSRRILEKLITSQEAVFTLIDCSMLPEDAKKQYKNHVADRVRAFSYSHSAWR
jgi:serine/threonine-protein kinase HipA